MLFAAEDDASGPPRISDDPSTGEWHEGRVYARVARKEDKARGWPRCEWKSVACIWYDQLADKAQSWYIEPFQTDNLCSPWELVTERNPFVRPEWARAYVLAAPSLGSPGAVLEHVLSTEAAPFFKKLPTAKDFPGYYARIKLPIDLATIKRRVESGKYNNTEGGIGDLWGDFHLMIKNAKVRE